MTLKWNGLLLADLGKSTRSKAYWKRFFRRKPKFERLKRGQRFQDCDKRYVRIVEVMKVVGDRVQIKTILSIPDLSKKSLGRITWARKNRFNRRSHGYNRLYGHCFECQIALGAEEPRGGLMGVTICHGRCARCLEEKGLIPSSDFNWPKEGRLAIFD